MISFLLKGRQGATEGRCTYESWLDRLLAKWPWASYLPFHNLHSSSKNGDDDNTNLIMFVGKIKECSPWNRLSTIPDLISCLPK